MIRQPPDGDPYLTELVGILNEELFRREPQLLGWRHDGTTLHLRFRAALSALWVQAHVQSTASGKGGASYDAVNFVSTTLVDCRADRIQDITVTNVGVDRHFVFLIPVQYDGAGSKILYDGQGGRPDNMSFFSAAPATLADAYTPTNISADRSYDANATTVEELADVLGTLLDDLKVHAGVLP